MRHLLVFLFFFYTSPIFAVDIIAHRGASGYLPEHTLEAATLAFAQSPDFIEQDVVLTRDGIPIVLHDIHLETVTDVEQVFPDRARTDGRYYAIDFTLDELRTLKVHERHNRSGQQVYEDRYKGSLAHFTLSSLDEHIELIQQLNKASGKNVGMYIEIKAPRWHRRQGTDISAIVLKLLGERGMLKPEAKLVLQCFDFSETQRIRKSLGYKGTLVQLVAVNSWKESDTDYRWLLTKDGLDEVAKVADGIGPWIPLLFAENDKQQGLGDVNDWVAWAKSRELFLHPYTYRSDARIESIPGPVLLERLNNEVGIDGIFTDQVPAVKAYLNQQNDN